MRSYRRSMFRAARWYAGLSDRERMELSATALMLSILILALLA